MINLTNTVPDAKIKLFADDTNLFIHGVDILLFIKQANMVLSDLNDWFLANKLSLHIDKTCYSLFANRNYSPDIVLKINNFEIKRVKSCEYLGVYIDDRPTWNEHKNTVYTEKIACFSGIFYKIGIKCPNNV